MFGPRNIALALGVVAVFADGVVGKLTTSTVKTSKSTSTSTSATKVVASTAPANPVAAIETVLAALGAGALSGQAAAAEVLAQILKATPTTTPASLPQATAALASIMASASVKGGVSPYELSAQYRLNGLAITDLSTILSTYSLSQNSPVNLNLLFPLKTIFPKKSILDAPYSLLEATLRGAIYIPPTFTYGKVKPMLLIHGTASLGALTFKSNFIKLFTGSTIADPVWINVPGALLGDAQANAEFVAYAINYISGISGGSNISIATWSQGGLDAQWAFKYWPSTRNVVSDFIAVSPDYHGTVLADLICPNGFPCSPSIYQQQYTSNFVSALRANGGDSAYVPTTSIYTGVFDEIVEPQQGVLASGFINDARNVGVSNNDVAITCAGYPAGTFNTHEGMLANSLTYFLAVDALTHAGPGKASRLNLADVCGSYLAPGLALTDFLATESTIPIAGVLLLAQVGGTVLTEPALKKYVTF